MPAARRQAKRVPKNLCTTSFPDKARWGTNRTITLVNPVVLSTVNQKASEVSKAYWPKIFGPIMRGIRRAKRKAVIK